MKICIMRHGYADHATPDSERRLTKFGKEKLVKNISQLKSKVDKFDYIISSPYQRALDTAEVIYSLYSLNNEVISDSCLEPGGKTEDILHLLKILKLQSVLLIGHLPDVAVFSSQLLQNGSSNLSFAPGSVAGIEIDEKLILGNGEIDFFIHL